MESHNPSFEDKLKRISRIITKVNFKSHIPKNSPVKKARMNSDLMIAAKPLQCRPKTLKPVQKVPLSPTNPQMTEQSPLQVNKQPALSRNANN